jgi:hypothetical protein
MGLKRSLVDQRKRLASLEKEKNGLVPERRRQKKELTQKSLNSRVA